MLCNRPKMLNKSVDWKLTLESRSLAFKGLPPSTGFAYISAGAPIMAERANWYAEIELI